MNDDAELTEWTADWQTEHQTAGGAKAIHDYVSKRTRLIRIWLWAELGVALVVMPILGFVAWLTQNPVERLAMGLLALITVGAVIVGRWNWRGVRDAAAGTTTEFVELSLARIQRVKQAVWMGWGILVAQVMVFTMWLTARFSGDEPGPGSETFAWSWLIFMSLVAVGHLLWLSRWVNRDAARFEALRDELK